MIDTTLYMYQAIVTLRGRSLVKVQRWVITWYFERITFARVITIPRVITNDSMHRLINQTTLFDLNSHHGTPVIVSILKVEQIDPNY